MNFMSGTLEDGKLRTALGEFPLSDKIRREVESAGTGRDVIVGVRPENFEDASLVSAENRPHGITLRTNIDVLESMGSDVFVYFTKDIEGGGMNSAELEELAKDSGRADTGSSGDTVVARLDAATRVREGQEAELWVDGRAMHVFDPASGRNLSLGAADAPAQSAVSAAGAGTSGAAASEAETAGPAAAGAPGSAGTAGAAGTADAAGEADTR
jgi:multiple sugar transport system ATP-binding protein